jgi:hypothetical protein
MRAGPPSALADSVLAAASDALVVGPPPALARGLIDALAPAVEPPDESSPDAPAATDREEPRVRLLCSPETADATFADFLNAAAAVDARTAGRLSVRTAPDLCASVTVADGTVYAHVALDDAECGAVPLDDAPAGPPTYGVVSGADEALVEAVEDAYGTRWDDADAYSLAVPGRGDLVASFADRWPDAGGTLADLLAAAEALPRTGAVDPVTACTLVAARHGVLTMELAEWAEDLGLTSRTEIARAKSRLVEGGLVDAESEPAGVGRPRHRLVLADGVASEASGGDLLARGRDALSEGVE